jgi:hypothetical protein
MIENIRDPHGYAVWMVPGGERTGGIARVWMIPTELRFRDKPPGLRIREGATDRIGLWEGEAPSEPGRTCHPGSDGALPCQSFLSREESAAHRPKFFDGTWNNL